jgi:drug/metabolite transporter (DMT)-like permease
VKKTIIASSATMAFVGWCCFGAVFASVLLLVYRIDCKKETGIIDQRNIGQFIVLIICMGTMQWMTNYVFKHMAVGYALSLFQLSTIVSVLFGYRFFKERDIRKKFVGTAIMIMGSVIIILFKAGN